MIFVTGGTGKTGRRVAERLRLGGRSVRIGSRGASLPFDWLAPASWAEALRGVEAVYLIHPVEPTASGEIPEFYRFAAEAGVKRLVLLIGRNGPATGNEDVVALQEGLRQSGLAWTLIRASWFYQNFTEDFLHEPVRRGQVALPVGDVREPFVDAEDIAAVAVAALTQDGHAGQTYDVTGPELLTFAEAVHQIQKATGRQVEYQETSMDRFRTLLAEGGVPSTTVDLLASLFGASFDGRNAVISDDVERVTGLPARRFADFAAQAAASGVWS